MSRARLEAILDALSAQHWELVPSGQHPNANADPFRLDEGGGILWAIRRHDGCVVELSFWAGTGLGEISKDLRDIFSCSVVGAPEIKLFFSKIKSDEWGRELQQFVWRIQDFCRRSGTSADAG